MVAPSREHLVELVVINSSLFANALISIDAGVGWMPVNQGDQCQLLDPMRKEFTKLPWAPLDYYKRLEERGVKEAADLEGAPDIYFEGDDDNRNGRKDASDLTSIVDPARKDVVFKRLSRGPVEAVFAVGFDRGALAFTSLMKVRALEKDGDCVAEAIVCHPTRTDAMGVTVCDGAWSNPIDQIRAHAGDWTQLARGITVSKVDVRFAKTEKPEYRVIADINAPKK